MATTKIIQEVCSVDVERSTTGSVEHGLRLRRTILLAGDTLSFGRNSSGNSGSAAEDTSSTDDTRQTVIANLFVQETVSGACGDHQISGRSPRQTTGDILRVLPPTFPSEQRRTTYNPDRGPEVHRRNAGRKLTGDCVELAVSDDRVVGVRRGETQIVGDISVNTCEVVPVGLSLKVTLCARNHSS